MKVSLYIRQRGTRKYAKATKKFYEPGTVFVLRYRSTWETIGAMALAEANRRLLTRSLELMNGVIPKPKRPRPEPTVLMLDAATDSYLAEVKDGRKKKTHQAYSIALRYFYECIGNKAIPEIDRADLLSFTTFLRDEKNQSARSCWNKFSNVMSFLKHHDLKPKVKPHDWPKFVEEEPEIYEQETLDKFFAVCDADERLLFEFLLMTGMREQEVIYATDRSVDFENDTIRVRHNPKRGWTPKQYKERSIPVPAALVEKLKRMLVDRGKGGLLFQTKNERPIYHFLDMAKAVARRAGIPEDEVWLHKFRATFCTRSLWSGVDLRTVQSWMGHTDLASTMRYLKPNRSAAMRDKVEAIWTVG